MRRFAAWTAVCILLCGAAAAILFHLRLPERQTVQLNHSAAALRAGETMPADWPEGSINPNAASAQELEALTGVGPAIALRILQEREKNGPFVYPEDLVAVYGIGEKTLMKLWRQLFLPPSSTREQE